MLTQEAPESSRPKRPQKPRGPWVVPFLTLVFLAVLFLRHDYWNWASPRPLLFGFLPVGLWWQGLVSILACVMMWLMVTLAWPQHLEDDALEAEKKRVDHEPPH